ncbi:tape measure domain-containing protein [Polaromonas sp. CG_9.5]|uniref:tape measure protein n=1 Tax=Polaromonas sp. CG_9.5 TaxID=3071705 RepID=UPI002DFD4D20|nr:tape measure domain-containing protein [Polaromonas sp. CG_9.5]
MAALGSLVVSLEANMAKFTADMGKAAYQTEQAMKKIDATSAQAQRALAGLDATAASVKMALASLATVAVGGMGIGQIITLTDEYTKFQAQLKLAGDSQAEFVQSFADVQRIAKGSQADIAATGVLYARIMTSTKELGLAQQTVADITETVNLALKVSGATTAESASATLQLSQAFASGALRGEEFNAVNEAAPRLMRALAEGIGVPVGALKQMATDGKLTSEVLAMSLPKALADLREEAKAITTISGAFVNLKNEVMLFVGAEAQASGSVSVLTTGINGLTNNLGLLTGVTVTLGASKLAQWTAGVAVESYKAMAASQAQAVATLASAQAQVTATTSSVALATARVAELRASVLSAEGAVALAVATNGLIPAQARAAAASVAHTEALIAQSVAQKGASLAASTASGALALLGGPIGAITTILGLGVTAWMLWGKSSTDANADALASTQTSSREITALLDKQIHKLRERLALAKNGQAEIAKQDSAGAQDAAQTLGKLNTLKAKGNQLTGVERIEMVELQGKYDERIKQLGTVKELSDGIAAVGQQSKADEWMTKYANKAEKLATELKKAKKDMGGAFTPEIEKRIREEFAEKTPKSPKGPKGKDPDADYRAYVKNLQNQISKTNELTLSEKLLSDIRNGTLTVDVGQEARLKAIAQEIDSTKEAIRISTERQVLRQKDEQDSINAIREIEAEKTKETARNAANVEQIRIGLMSEVDQEVLAYGLRMQELQKFHDDKAENVRLVNEVMEAETARHEQAKADMQAAHEMNSLSMYGETADALYGLMQKAGQEQSALGKAAFLASKAIAVAEIIMQTNVAAQKAQGQLGIFGLPMSGIILATGYARAGMVAGMAIAEVSAEGGYDIPAGKNPIAQLHEKEMVLPQAQADVIRGLASGGGAGGEMKLTIVNNTSAPIGQVTEQRISATERALIIQEAVGTVASQMGDPNSKTSRAFGRNFSAPRSR